MKRSYILSVLFVALVLLAPRFVVAQACHCPVVKVLLYDFDNSAAKPAWYTGGPVTSAQYSRQQIAEFTDWKAAPQFGSGGFLEVALKDRGEGLRFFTASFHKNADGTFSGTTADVFAPPDGAINEEADYIVTGRFSGSGNGFLLEVHLEDAKDRSRFAETTVTLSSLANAIEAGKEVAQQIAPLLETIRKYQHSVRDEKRVDETAISAKYELTSDKQELKAGEITTLHLKLFDCDDHSPMKHRKVILKPNFAEGTITPSEPETDDNGEATATFKAGRKTETVPVIAVYSYTSVTNKSSYAGTCDKGLAINVQAQYKLTVEFEASGHGENGGTYHAFVSGEAGIDLKKTGDCYEAALTDQNGMEFHVREVVFQSDQGHASYAGPALFVAPVTVSLGNCEKPTLKIAFGSFGDPAEQYTTSEGATFQSPMLYSLALATLGSVNLERMRSQAGQLKAQAAQFKGREAEVDAAAKRLNAHRNDPRYRNTPQGKADMALMNEMAHRMGYGGKGRPDATRMRNIDNLKAMNRKQQEINQKYSRPGYVGSAEYVADKQQLAALKSKVNMGDLQTAAGIDASILEVEAPFNPESDKPVDKLQKDRIREVAGSSGGWEFGQFRIRIEKTAE